MLCRHRDRRSGMRWIMVSASASDSGVAVNLSVYRFVYHVRRRSTFSKNNGLSWRRDGLHRGCRAIGRNPASALCHGDEARWEQAGCGIIRGLVTRLSRIRQGQRRQFRGPVRLLLPRSWRSAGFAVNIAQLYNVKSSLQQVLDAAVTSTARDLTTGMIEPKDARAMVEAFLEANGDPAFLAGDQLVLDTADRRPDRQAPSRPTAYVDVDLSFRCSAVGDTHASRARRPALYSDKTIEVAMMLDVTGSMAKQGKMDKIGDLQDRGDERRRDDAAEPGSEEPPRARRDRALRRRASTPASWPTTCSSRRSGLACADRCRRPDRPAAGFRHSRAAMPHRQLRHRAQGQERRSRFHRRRPDTVAHEQEGKKYLALVNRDDLRLRMNMPRSRADPADRRQDSCSTRSTIQGRRLHGRRASPSSGATTCCRRNGACDQERRPGRRPGRSRPKKIAKVAILMTDGQFNTAFAGVQRRQDSHQQPGQRRRAATPKACAPT